MYPLTLIELYLVITWLEVIMAKGNSRRRGRRGRNNFGGSSNDSATFSGISLLTSLVGGAKKTVSLRPSNISALAGVGALYEGIRWNSCSLVWKPACATTTSGMVSFAYDLNPKAPSQEREGIAKYHNSVSHAVSMETKNPLIIPSSVLSTRRTYILSALPAVTTENAPVGVLIANSSGTSTDVVGELWVRYNVTLTGSHG